MSMSDYIKREDAVCVALATKSLGNTAYSDRFEIASRLRYLPAADVVERKKGEWVHLGGDEWLCPFCGHVISTEGSWEHPHERGAYFCENCGAEMWEPPKGEE